MSEGRAHLQSWGVDGKCFQEFDITDDCYILDSTPGNNQGGRQRLIKYAKEEMLQKELPPEENPNAIQDKSNPKTYAMIGKAKPSDVREGEEDLASLDIDKNQGDVQ